MIKETQDQMFKKVGGRIQRDFSTDPNFHSANNQWIIDVKCPFYEKFLPLFENSKYRGEDESEIKTTFNGYQYDVTPTILPQFGGSVVRSDKLNPDSPEVAGFPSSEKLKEFKETEFEPSVASNFPPIDHDKFNDIDWNELGGWVMEKIRHYKLPIKTIKVSKTWCDDYYDFGNQAIHHHGPLCISMVMFMDEQQVVSEKVNGMTAQNGMLYTLMPHPDGTMLYNQFGPYPGRTILMDGRVWHGVYPCKAPRRSFVVDFDFEYYAPHEAIPGVKMKLNPDVPPENNQ